MELKQYLDSVDINKVTMEDIKSNALKIINDIELINYCMKARFGDDFMISDNDKLFYDEIKNDTTSILQKTLNHLNAIDKLFSNNKKEDKKEKVSKKEYFKDYYQKNKERQNELQRIRRQKKKLQKLNNDLN